MIFAAALLSIVAAGYSSARWRRERKLRLNAEARLAELEAVARIGSWEFDLASDRILWSEETFRIFGLAPGTQEPDFADVLLAIHPEDSPQFDRAIQQAISRREPYMLDLRIICPGGVQKHVHAQGSAVCRGSEVVRLIGTVLDITDRKLAETELEHRATYDVLTGVMNRGCVLERLDAEISLAQQRGEALSLCLCDIDRFKNINDTYGHAAGDEILSAFGQLLREGTRRSDLTGRLGGDEFCMVFPRTTPQEALICAERIRQRLQAMAFGMNAGMAYSVSATFGIAPLRPGGLSAELREAADKALYEAKQSGRNRTVAVS